MHVKDALLQEELDEFGDDLMVAQRKGATLLPLLKKRNPNLASSIVSLIVMVAAIESELVEA